ncbi:MAG TPA: HEAT repeat domain-containing protein [Verrucomicrobiae bacterium]|nr:HEAT repeat domain-containing protein [Verrucomicrobiae bacterium]
MVLDNIREVPGRDTLGPEAADAIKQIGTNGLPSLVAWMGAHRRPWKAKIAMAVQKLPAAIRPSKLPGWLDYSEYNQRVWLAYTGFRILGTEAAPAVPEVARIARDPHAVGSKVAISALSQIGKPAVPELIALLTTNNAPTTRRDVLMGLGDIGPNAAESVPVVIACLKETDETMACLAARTLSRIRRRSELAIPALVEGLDDRRYGVKVAAVRALGDYGHGALPATAFLRDLCVQPDIQLAREAEQALRKIDASELNETEFRPVFGIPGFP